MRKTIKPIWLLAALPAVAITFAAIAQETPSAPTTAPAQTEVAPPAPPEERGPRGMRDDRPPRDDRDFRDGPRDGGPRDGGPRDGGPRDGPFGRGGPGGPGGPEGPGGPGGMRGGPGGPEGSGGPGGSRRPPSADTMRNYLELVDRYAAMSKDPSVAGVGAVITAADLLRARGPEAAIKYFESTLPGVTDASIARAIRLQLAELYKASGNTDKALEQLGEVMKSK